MDSSIPAYASVPQPNHLNQLHQLQQHQHLNTLQGQHLQLVSSNTSSNRQNLYHFFHFLNCSNNNHFRPPRSPYHRNVKRSWTVCDVASKPIAPAKPIVCRASIKRSAASANSKASKRMSSKSGFSRAKRNERPRKLIKSPPNRAACNRARSSWWVKSNNSFLMQNLNSNQKIVATKIPKASSRSGRSRGATIEAKRHQILARDHPATRIHNIGGQFPATATNQHQCDRKSAHEQRSTPQATAATRSAAERWSHPEVFDEFVLNFPFSSSRTRWQHRRLQTGTGTRFGRFGGTCGSHRRWHQRRERHIQRANQRSQWLSSGTVDRLREQCVGRGGGETGRPKARLSVGSDEGTIDESVWQWNEWIVAGRTNVEAYGRTASAQERHGRELLPESV